MSQIQEGDEISIICFHCQQTTLQHYLYSKHYSVRIDDELIEMINSWYFCTKCLRENKVEDI